MSPRTRDRAVPGLREVLPAVHLNPRGLPQLDEDRITLAPRSAAQPFNEGSNVAQHPSLDFPVEVMTVGHSCWYRGDSCSRQTSCITAIELVTSGEGELEVNGVRHALPTDSMFVLHLGENHCYRARSVAPWCKQFMLFRPGSVQPVLAALRIDAVSVFGLPDQFLPRVRELFNSALDLARTKPPTYRQTIAAAAYEALLIAAETAAVRGPAADLPLPVIAALTFAKDSNGVRVTPAAMARAAHIGLSYLDRLFKEHIGITPHEWLIRYKLEQAHQLLKFTDLSVTAVADRLEFCDSAQFCRLFKKHTGCTALEYRRSVR
ncbi:AraC family transcriptional regulator [bacterium]|nr:AraC family transcriptional regulator [bacterium]